MGCYHPFPELSLADPGQSGGETLAAQRASARASKTTPRPRMGYKGIVIARMDSPPQVGRVDEVAGPSIRRFVSPSRQYAATLRSPCVTWHRQERSTAFSARCMAAEHPELYGQALRRLRGYEHMGAIARCVGPALVGDHEQANLEQGRGSMQIQGKVHLPLTCPPLWMDREIPTALFWWQPSNGEGSSVSHPMASNTLCRRFRTSRFWKRSIRYPRSSSHLQRLLVSLPILLRFPPHRLHLAATLNDAAGLNAIEIDAETARGVLRKGRVTRQAAPFFPRPAPASHAARIASSTSSRLLSTCRAWNRITLWPRSCSHAVRAES